MPTTRQAEKEEHQREKEDGHEATAGEKRHVSQDQVEVKEEAPPQKKPKTQEGDDKNGQKFPTSRQTGTIDRGHIYFFYRPRVEHEEAHSIDDVQKLHMLLVPRPPKFSQPEGGSTQADEKNSNDDEMTLLEPGADALPAQASSNLSEAHYRLITIGKKELPDPATKSRRGKVFWATVAAVGDDLHDLEKGMQGRSYETKTRGTRHEEPARLAARGVYAIVNNDPSTPSKAETHLGIYISHPKEMGDVQDALGIHKASSFVIQVKNPLAPNTGNQRTLPPSRRAEYPEEVLDDIFGRGKKGREAYGLRFVDCERIELLDYEGTELLLIASRGDAEGVDESLGEGRGQAMEHLEEDESSESVHQVFKELGLDEDEFPQDALKGEWI
ncbi:hypothetical protein ONZ45_g12568 [Pleurotus djamor]|nr:hypothetical protein ONZ45_g12568 [Pleurotus djamor]